MKHQARAADMTEIVTEVAIVGGGLSGLTLACALGTAGVPTVCLDRDSPQRQQQEGFDGRTTALSHASTQIMDGAGIWSHLAGAAQPILDIRVADQGSALFLHYDHQEIGDQAFGHIVENRDIRRAQFARLAQLDAVTHLAPVAVVDITRQNGQAVLALEDGRTVRARLVVGADGRHSLCRRQAGIAQRGWAYDQQAIAVTIAHDEPHYGTAVELFLPFGPFAMLPMTDDADGTHRTSVVWTERATLTPWYLGLDDDRFAAELQLRCGDWLGRVRPIGGRYAFPLSVTHADRYIDQRLALVGEAAHAIHPIAGQGLNMGLRDVAALAEVVVDTWRLGLDVGGAEPLDRYQRWRRTDNLTLVAVTDGLNRLFSNDIAPLRLARGLGLAAIHRLPPLQPLKRLFMRHAMGTVGTLPRLVMGQKL